MLEIKAQGTGLYRLHGFSTWTSTSLNSCFDYVQAKVLLEGGQTLHRPLLRKIIEHLSDFVNKCNVVRYNKYLLHILTFIRQCVGVSALELTQMADIFGILPVVYTSEAIEEFRGQQSMAAAKSPNFRAMQGGASRRPTLGRIPS